ncbi:HNH endonuclease [Chryseobacterium gleum]|uniref:HNH endonuclease signature motif containing protein n=1 Tax=Chryseobacterium gleum TaxID=250 RepID=UPI00241E971B|nr:HNH endonuclease [Chryseobacterium gleum]
MKSEYLKKCFFCSQEITGKKTLEHIIPNSLLGKLNIKEKNLIGEYNIQYSRIKVPAHSSCNNNFGSEYEDKILQLLDDPETLYNEINSNDQLDLRYSHSNDSTSLIITWLSKIYYGLFYNDYLKTRNNDWQNLCFEIINSENFKLTQNSYQLNTGFNLPSSLYAFKTKKKEFNLRTNIYPSSILMNINGLILILCIADGFLCKNYLNSYNLATLNDHLKENDHLNTFPTDLFAFAEISALRLNIPKTPSFIFNEKEIFNLSLNTLVSNPNEYYKVNPENIEKERNNILESLGVQII